jgi:hypothetical protein
MKAFACQIKGRRDTLKALEEEPRTIIFMSQPTACWKAWKISALCWGVPLRGAGA